MALIKEGKYEAIKKEYQIEFDVIDNNMIFKGIENFSFPTKLLSSDSPIFISYMNLEQPEIAEIIYFIDSPNGERKRFLLEFEQDVTTWKFKNISLTDN